MSSATTFEMIEFNLLSNVTGGFSDRDPHDVPRSPVSGEYCKDGMDFGVSGSFKVKTPVGLEVSGDGTLVKCK